MSRPTLAEVLAEHRRRAGLSQDEVAEKMKEAEAAGVGRAVTQNAISFYETGAREPGAKVMAALAWVYGVDVSELYASEAGCGLKAGLDAGKSDA